MEESRKPKIIFDSREKKSLVVENLKTKCELEEKLLDVGDFLLSDRVCCEKKTTTDFVQSIVDKRMFNQLKNMKENFPIQLLIIEGNGLYDNNVNADAIRGALASIAINFRVPILWTKSPKETADMLYIIAKREQFGEKRPIRVRGERKPKDIKRCQEYLIAGLPDIDSIRARNLLKHFKCPEFVFTASEKELRRVNGIGKELARKIRDVIEKDYE
ncbi:MAG: hypothetical protein J7J38_04075 [Candidatus Aenigmarchaeota archaeon]|nr:hypothetical protein [Candidatus Aenigmarchaeota archaeon]